MTKYVLNSGGLKNQPDKAKAFLQEVFKGLGPSPRVLISFFAAGREYWETKFEEYSQSYKNLSPEGLTPSFMLAYPDAFVEQVRDSDVILFQGGDATLLRFWLSKFDIPKIWSGKVVAGSSTGSDVFCKYFWTCDWRKCMEGLGFLPIKFIPHFKSSFGNSDPRGPIDWGRAYKELADYGEKGLPIHALEEGEYIVLEL